MKPLCCVCRWRPVIARDRCRTCYEYLRRFGKDRSEDLVVAHGIRVTEGREGRIRPPRPLIDKLMERTQVRENECWEWMGVRGPTGYGMFSQVHRATQQAHRLMWQELRGPIPDGLELDHLCRNRSCVNPDHLEPVTHAENMRRAAPRRGRGSTNGRKTHCKHGHPYDEENTRIWKGRRYCRACQARNIRSYWARQKQEAVGE